MFAPKIKKVIISKDSTVETRSIQTALMLGEDPPTMVRCLLEELTCYKSDLQAREAMTVGSVEFVRESFRIANIEEPPNLTYHGLDEQLLGRSVRQTPLSEVKDRCFIKPVVTKLFTGFIFEPSGRSIAQDAHTLEQIDVVKSLPPETLVWVSEVVEFECEWRLYISGGNIIGRARYDPDGADDAPEPDAELVDSAILSLAFQHPYVLDVGVLKSGKTVIVEINDAWAIGLYGSALKPNQYYEFLENRWQSL